MTYQIAHSQITFQKTYGTSRVDYPIAMQLTSDGGIIMVGNTFGGDIDTGQILIVKTDSKGDTLWTRITTVPGLAEANSVIQSSDGGFLIAGTLYQPTAGTRTLIIKTDSSGNFLWVRTIGSTNQSEFAVEVLQMSSANYLVAATHNGKASLIKVSSEGDVIWTKIYFGNNSGALSMCQTNDGNYVIVGPGDAGLADHTDLFQMKVDSDGNIIWSKEIGTPDKEYVHFVSATEDNGTIIGGATIDPAAQIYMFLIKTDSNGIPDWAKIYKGPTYYTQLGSVYQTNDGGFIVSGTDNNVPYPSYTCLLRTGSDGEILWTKTFHGYDNEMNYSVQIATDGGYVIANTTLTIDSGDYEYHLIRTDSTGNSGCNESFAEFETSDPYVVDTDAVFSISPGGTVDTPDVAVTRGIKVSTICSAVGINTIYLNENPFSVFPNPATDIIQIQINNFRGSDITIRNTLGEIVFEQPLTGQNNFDLDLSDLPKGIYFVTLNGGRESINRKIILQ